MGGFVGIDQLDMPLSFEGARAAAASLGSGVVMVFEKPSTWAIFWYGSPHFSVMSLVVSAYHAASARCARKSYCSDSVRAGQSDVGARRWRYSRKSAR